MGDERLVRLEKLERVRRAASLVSIELHAVIAQNGEILLFVDGVGVERAIDDGSNALGGVGARNVAARASSRLALCSSSRATVLTTPYFRCPEGLCG